MEILYQMIKKVFMKGRQEYLIWVIIIQKNMGKIKRKKKEIKPVNSNIRIL